jgi:hypothetical protein
MSGSEHPSGAGRLTALATLLVSATLFLTALFGIASIDPNADAASPAGGPSLHEISLDEKRGGASERRDCPFRERGRDRAPGGHDAGDGVTS